MSRILTYGSASMYAIMGLILGVAFASGSVLLFGFMPLDVLLCLEEAEVITLFAWIIRPLGWWRWVPCYGVGILLIWLFFDLAFKSTRVGA